MNLSDRYTDGTLIRARVLESTKTGIVKPSTGAMTYSVRGSADSIYRVQILDQNYKPSATGPVTLPLLSCNCANGMARAGTYPTCFHSASVLIRLGFK